MENEFSGHLCEICGVDTNINGIRYATMTLSYASKYFCQKCVKQGETVIEKKVCHYCNCELKEKTNLIVVKKEVPVVAPVIITRGGSSPDVWYGYGSGVHSEENIAYPKGHPNEGQPIPFHDKRSKAAAMKIAGVREAGDRIHGARNEDMVPKNRKTYI